MTSKLKKPNPAPCLSKSLNDLGFPKTLKEVLDKEKLPYTFGGVVDLLEKRNWTLRDMSKIRMFSDRTVSRLDKVFCVMGIDLTRDDADVEFVNREKNG